MKCSVAEITSRDTYSNNIPVIGGMFDPRLGVLEPGLKCPTDGLDYIKTPGYFGHIEYAKNMAKFLGWCGDLPKWPNFYEYRNNLNNEKKLL